MFWASKTGTVTSELLCNRIVLSIGRRPLVFSDFCVDLSSDFLDLILSYLLKLGEDRYVLTRATISSYRSKLALCLSSISLSMISNLVTAIVFLYNGRKELSMSLSHISSRVSPYSPSLS